MKAILYIPSGEIIHKFNDFLFVNKKREWGLTTKSKQLIVKQYVKYINEYRGYSKIVKYPVVKEEFEVIEL